MEVAADVQVAVHRAGAQQAQRPGRGDRAPHRRPHPGAHRRHRAARRQRGGQEAGGRGQVGQRVGRRLRPVNRGVRRRERRRQARAALGPRAPGAATSARARASRSSNPEWRPSQSARSARAGEIVRPRAEAAASRLHATSTSSSRSAAIPRSGSCSRIRSAGDDAAGEVGARRPSLHLQLAARAQLGAVDVALHPHRARRAQRPPRADVPVDPQRAPHHAVRRAGALVPAAHHDPVGAERRDAVPGGPYLHAPAGPQHRDRAVAHPVGRHVAPDAEEGARLHVRRVARDERRDPGDGRGGHGGCIGTRSVRDGTP